MCVCVSVCVRVHMCMSACMHVHACVRLCACVCACTCVHSLKPNCLPRLSQCCCHPQLLGLAFLVVEAPVAAELSGFGEFSLFHGP